MKRKKIYVYICLILKYLFAMLFPVLAVMMHKMNWRYIIVALAEVVFIAFVTNLLCHVKNWLGYIFNVVALLFMNIQFAVLYWGSTFISAVMLTNLDSVNAISGKFFVYGLTVVMVLLFSFLPITSIPGNKKPILLLGGATVVWYVSIILTGVIQYSPFRAGYMLYQQMERNRMVNQAVYDAKNKTTENVESDTEQLQEKSEFYSDSVSDYIKKPEDIPENPNVILIFVEGLSQNIIDDSRSIMPNMAELQDNSIIFTNYYNHTFATYMGLSGQLHSDYQRENYDQNPMISMQDIFKSYGYETAFINTEPRNKEFSEYLANFEFDELITDENRVDGMANGLSDKSAYELLFETALEQNEKEKPFFLAMYSFGTHASLDGVYEEFAGESNALLNRFYDLDVQVGTFLKRFHESELAENTIIVLTSDHATYQDADFVTAFPEYRRDAPTLDRIPLMIYYDGITPKSYDANGRNSLDMAPTILDLLDMSAPNYFLGNSLFALESSSFFDTYFESLGSCYYTADGEVNMLSKEQMQEFEKSLTSYYALKFSDNLRVKEFEETAYIYAEVNEDQTTIMTELYNAEKWDVINYAIWSQTGGQDDLQWFYASGDHENCFKYNLDLSGYNRKGVYYIHVYGKMEDSEELVFLVQAIVNKE